MRQCVCELAEKTVRESDSRPSNEVPARMAEWREIRLAPGAARAALGLLSSFVFLVMYRIITRTYVYISNTAPMLSALGLNAAIKLYLIAAHNTSRSPHSTHTYTKATIKPLQLTQRP